MINGKGRIMLVLSALAAGFINGLFGTGGGIILVFVLNELNKKKKEKEGDGKDVFVTVLTVTTVMSVVSAVVYYIKGGMDYSECIKYGIAAVPGGILGAYLLDRLKTETVNKIFCALVIWAGMNMSGIV